MNEKKIDICKKPSFIVRTLSIIALLILTVLVYWNGVYGDFVRDDLALVRNNPSLRQEDPSALFTEQSNAIQTWDTYAYFRPITSLSFWIDYRIHGMFPFGFHVTNIVLHLFCVLLFYYVLKKFLSPANYGAAWLGAAIFALHPFNTWSVTWISGRSTILATIFFLLALAEYIDFRRSGRVLPFYLSICAFVLGLLSNELLLLFLPVVILWESIANRPFERRAALVSFSPFLFISLAFLTLRYAILGAGVGSQLSALSFFDMIAVIADRIILLLAPYGLEKIDVPRILGFIVVISLLILIIVLIAKKKRDEAFWLALMFLGLVPVIKIFQIFGRTIADGSLYLSSIGFAAIVALGITKWSDSYKKKYPRSSIYALLAIFLLSSYSVMVHLRSFDWDNDMMFHYEILRADRESAEGHSGLAYIYAGMGDHDSVEVHARAAFKANAYQVQSWLAIAKSYTMQERYIEAGDAIQNAMKSAPDNPYIFDALGNLELKRNDYPEARKYYLRAIDLSPNCYHANFDLGKLEFSSGRYVESRMWLEAARKIDPINPDVHRQLSMVYSALGEKEAAMDAWREYLRLPGVKIGDFIGDENAPGVLPNRK